MADHDRDAGSRGEEEAPRDPAQDPREPAQLRYGEQADRPYADLPPTQPNTSSWEEPPTAAAAASSSSEGFFRRRRTQIMAAAIGGLLAGGLLGGLTVASATDHDHDRFETWVEHEGGWRPPDGFRMPGRMDEGCYRSDDEFYCVAPPPRFDDSDSFDDPDSFDEDDDEDLETAAPAPTRTS
ncbi:hypothetical protein [Nonomuraea fuscirosea]|uniref:hypothetical protein n=1 Tax=Nonomuraea fuscirosea TaxID=1291556 RepID=UPI0034241593